MRPRDPRGRKIADGVVKALSGFVASAGIVFLVWILYEVVRRGAVAMSPAFFTSLPSPPGGVGGGLANAMLGTLWLTAVAALFGIPAGILAGVYLAEFGGSSRFGALVRFLVNVMMGIPSIISGLFVYTVLVVPLGHFSGWAGSVSLAILMLPIVARTTEDMLGLVPTSLREAGLALGVPRWKVTLQVVFRAAKRGLLTGVLLAVARVSGETAPLLFTALNSPYWPRSFSEPVANLTVTIFNYAMSPYGNWQRAAWGASFVITVAILALTLTTRLLTRERNR